MVVYVQWTQQNPSKWAQTDCARWRSLPKRPLPTEAAGKDNRPGWVMAVNVMGTAFDGWDHYAMQPLPALGGCRLYFWNDDPQDFAEPYGEVWTYLPVGPDEALSTPEAVLYNVRRVYAIYGDSPKRVGDATYHPWEEFPEPDPEIVRHGVWVSDDLFLRHRKARSFHSWREWTAGVPAEQVENGRVRVAAAHHGHSVSRFLRDTDLATGVHVATEQENQMASSAGAGETESFANFSAGTDRLAAVWTLNEEAGGTWENDAAVAYEISAGDANITGGFLTVGGSVGHFACVNTGLTADTEAHPQDEPAFTHDAGIKSASYTGSWSTCASTDKFEALLAEQCNASHGNCSGITLVYDADSSVTAPYPAPVGRDLMVIQ